MIASVSSTAIAPFSDQLFALALSKPVLMTSVSEKFPAEVCAKPTSKIQELFAVMVAPQLSETMEKASAKPPMLLMVRSVSSVLLMALLRGDPPPDWVADPNQMVML